MKVQELTENIKQFLIPQKIEVKYSGCIRANMNPQELEQLGQWLDELWGKCEKNNRTLNSLIYRNYECLTYEIKNYHGFLRNK